VPDLNPATLVAGLIFGLIGFVAFTYGKATERWMTMVLGLVLMVFPYLVSEPWLIYTIGSALTIGLFVIKNPD
jgi:hypothetical protein